MELTVSLGSTKHIEFIRDLLDKEFRLLQSKGVEAGCQERLSGGFTFWDCNARPKRGWGRRKLTEEVAGRLLVEHIASAVAAAVLDCWEESILDRLVQEELSCGDKADRNGLIGRARQVLTTGEGDRSASGNAGGETRPRRRKEIASRAREYLQTADQTIILDGFITFRLQDYLEDAQEAVNRAIDDYLMEREYEDFIQLLRYFVDSQEPRVDTVHVLLRPSGRFQLFDAQSRVIEHQNFEGFTVNLADGDINYEDLLVSALITIAPKKIMVHIPEPVKATTTMTTIVKVFGDRVVTCTGCTRCTRSQLKRF